MALAITTAILGTITRTMVRIITDPISTGPIITRIMADIGPTTTTATTTVIGGGGKRAIAQNQRSAKLQHRPDLTEPSLD